MRLIDADALIEELNASHFPGAPYVDAGISIAIGKICDAPTIEPQRMSDLISRARVLDRLKYTRPPQGEDSTKERFRFLQWIADNQIIKETPSAERKEGEADGVY